MNSTNNVIGISLALLFISGCASNGTDSPIPQDGPTMLEIYNGGPKDHSLADAKKQVIKKKADDDNAMFPDLKAKKSQVKGTKKIPGRKPRYSSKTYQPPRKPIHGDYIRNSMNEIKQLFPRLENPDISIFIYPHLATTNSVPVPGYTTAIPLYESVQYALPGEKKRIR